MFLHRKDLSCHSLLWAWRFQTYWSLLVLSQGQQWAVVWRFSLEHDRKVLIFHSLLQGYSSDKLCPLPDGNRIYKQKSSWLWKRYWSFLFKISQFSFKFNSNQPKCYKILTTKLFHVMYSFPVPICSAPVCIKRLNCNLVWLEKKCYFIPEPEHSSNKWKKTMYHWTACSLTMQEYCSYIHCSKL